MSATGPFIGHGYVKGKGPVEVYTSPKSTKRVDVLTRRGEWIFIDRSRVVFTKRKES